jgi:hypothetical protein
MTDGVEGPERPCTRFQGRCVVIPVLESKPRQGLFAALLPPQPAPISPCPDLFDFRGCNPAFRNVDLTATRNSENGSSAPWRTPPQTSRIRSRAIRNKATRRPAGCSAITLVHSLYRFTPHGGFECNYGGRDTRGWFRMITPLGKPSFVDATDHQELGAELRPCDDHCGERSHLASHT